MNMRHSYGAVAKGPKFVWPVPNNISLCAYKQVQTLKLNFYQISKHYFYHSFSGSNPQVPVLLDLLPTATG